MAYSLCFGSDDRAPVEVSEVECNTWFTAMFQTPPPPGWIPVPRNLLPERFSSGYFQACAFAARPGSQLDTRPLITHRLRLANPEEWDRLWFQHKTPECPVCFQTSDSWNMPMNGTFDTRCTHWVCIPCWFEIAKHDRRCPICRYDLDAWFADWEGDTSTEEESEEDMETDVETEAAPVPA